MIDKYLMEKNNLPLGLQRKRTKEFNLDEYSKSINGLECIVVSRPSRWGNPFKLLGDMIYVDAGHRRKILSRWVCWEEGDSFGGGHTIEEVIKLFKDMMLDLDSHDVEPEIKERFKYMRDNIKDLRGKNLACFCNEGSCCHRQVLIELANGI